MLTSRLATTPGKRLVIPLSHTAGAAVWTSGAVVTELLVAAAGARRAGEAGVGRRTARGDATASPRTGVPSARTGPSCVGSRRGGHRDLAVDDLLLVGVDLGLDRVQLPTGRGVVDAAGLEVVDLLAGLHAAVLHRLHEVEHRDVDPFDHRGEDDVAHRGGRRLGLVGVHADRLGVRGLGRLEDAGAGATGGVVDDVGAGVEHALRGGLALGRVVEPAEVRRLGQVLRLDLDARVDLLRARDVAGLELGDQRGLHTADEADVGLLRGQRGRRTDEEGALVLGEDQVGDVRGLGGAVVDDRELDLRELLGHLGERVRVREADGDDRAVPGLRQRPQAVLLGRLGLAVGRLRLLRGHAQRGLGLVQTGGRRVVERLVATAADVVG